MTRAARAESARPSRKPSLIWTSAPRLTGRMRAIAVAGSVAIVAMTGGAAVLNSSGSGGAGTGTPVTEFENAQAAQYCGPGLVFLQGQLALAQTLLNVQLSLPPQFQDPVLIANLQAQIGSLQAQIQACVNLP